MRRIMSFILRANLYFGDLVGLMVGDIAVVAEISVVSETSVVNPIKLSIDLYSATEKYVSSYDQVKLWLILVFNK